MSLVQFGILAIDGLKCNGTRVINCDWIASGMKPVWVITEGCNDGDLVKIDYEDNGGTMGVAVSDGNEFVVLNTTIDAIQEACCESGIETPPPPPVDVNVLNCDGTTTTQTFDTAPAPVEIIQTKPFVICAENPVQIEVGGFGSCYGGINAHIEIVRNEDGTFNRYVAHLKDGSGTIIDPAIPTQIDECDTTINGTLDVRTDCDAGTATEEYSDTIKAVIGHVVNVKDVCKTDEIDYIHTNWLEICVGGVQWYVAEEYRVDNTTGIQTLLGNVYKQGANGTPSATAPVGVIVDGKCGVCTKEIFATHDRYISIAGIPPNFVAYEMTNDLPTQGLDVSNAYFHLIYPTLNGTQNIAYGTQLTDYFANIQDGILFSDIAGVQAVIDFVLPSMGLNVGDVIYAINTANLPIFFLSPTAVTELANNTYLHIYWGVDATHNNYNEKADVNVISANPNVLLGGIAECVGIQEIKEKDSCTGEETYRYVIEDLNGNLVPVTDIYPDFVEADVLLECPAVSKTVEVPNCAGTLVEKEVDIITATYLLNQEHKHTEKIYDVVVANINGSIPYTFTAPRNVALSYAGIVLTNDSLSPQSSFWTDFGDGYNDVGGNPQHTYNADGTYEIKSYLIATSGNKILFITKEVTITAGTIVYNSITNPQAINKNYNVARNVGLLQNYCDSTPIGSPYNPNGTAATLQGTAWLIPPAVRDELEDNADYQVSTLTPTVQRRHENFVVTGTTPLVIPAGAISISVTKTNNTGVVNISGDNATVFPLTFNRENFTDSVNEAVSTLSAYTITGTLAGTTYKVHIIR